MAKIESKLCALFIFATLFFLIYHHAVLEWDFAAYVSNAKYLAGQGTYYEAYRAPLMPALLLVFSIFGWTASEYLFIAFCSGLFFFASMKFADAINADRFWIYLLMLSPYFLFTSTWNGTEILSLAFALMCLSFLITKTDYAGFFLGLAFLARYNYTILLPLLFSADWKRMIKNIAGFAAAIFPWLLYNLIITGNMITSIADSYVLNIKFRDYISNPVNWTHILYVFWILTPFVIYGVWILLSKFIQDKKQNSLKEILINNNSSILVLLYTLLFAYQYSTTPVKDIRYLFPLVLSAAYFAYLSISVINEKWQKLIKAALIISLVICSIALINLELNREYSSAQKTLKSIESFSFAENCRIMSNNWVLLNYFGRNTEIFPRKEELNYYIKQGNFVVLYPNIGEPEYASDKEFLANHSVLYSNNELVILGDINQCNPLRNVDKTYIQALKESIILRKHYKINTNPCFMMFEKNPLLEKSCNLINGNGFKLDSNRIAV